jgi:hypothetical protein
MNFLKNSGKTMDFTVFLWKSSAVAFAIEIAEDTLDFDFSRMVRTKFF